MQVKPLQWNDENHKLIINRFNNLAKLCIIENLM